MKKIIFTCLMLISLNLSAKEWEPYWIAAVENFHNEDYVSAEHNFNQTIDWMENENDAEHPSVYVDRARLYLLLNKYEEALTDLNKAIFSDKLKHWERIKAVSARVTARAKLGFSDGYEEDMEFLVKNFEVQIENTENYLIIRNMPKKKEFKESMTNFFIYAGICHNKEDIRMLSSDICIVSKAGQLDKKENASDSPCACAINFNKQVVVANNQTIAACKRFCDDNAVTAITGWCAFFPVLCVVNACNKAVLQIQNNCHACCQTGLSQDTCIAPFADIVSVMQQFLPPCGCQ